MTGRNDGVHELVSMFDTAGDAVAAEVRKVLFRGGMNVKRAATAAATRELGVHRINMDIEQGDDEIAAVIESEGPGGAIMEFGTPTLPGGRPFLGPALAKEAPNFEQFVGQAVAKALRR